MNQAMVSEFVSAICEGREPSVTGVDGLRAVEVVAAAYDFARKAVSQLKVQEVQAGIMSLSTEIAEQPERIKSLLELQRKRWSRSLRRYKSGIFSMFFLLRVGHLTMRGGMPIIYSAR